MLTLPHYRWCSIVVQTEQCHSRWYVGPDPCAALCSRPGSDFLFYGLFQATMKKMEKSENEKHEKVLKSNMDNVFSKTVKHGKISAKTGETRANNLFELGLLVVNEIQIFGACSGPKRNRNTHEVVKIENKENATS